MIFTLKDLQLIETTMTIKIDELYRKLDHPRTNADTRETLNNEIKRNKELKRKISEIILEVVV